MYRVLWEAGGAATNSGCAQVIAGAQGERLRPIHIRTSGHLSNGDHAQFSVPPGAWLIKARWGHGETALTCAQVGAGGELRDKYIWENGHWIGEPAPTFLRDAIAASTEKSQCYHCRHPHYVK